MKVAVASDHRALDLKDALIQWLSAHGHEPVDCGGYGSSVDYPEVAAKAAREVASGRCDRAIVACGSGIGVSVAANKVHGIRAALVRDEEEARLSRQHNDANVLCFGRNRIDPDQARKIAEAWLEALFEGGRHQRRVEMIAAVEAEEAMKNPQSS